MVAPTATDFATHLAASRLRNLGRLIPALLVVHAVTALLEAVLESSGMDVPVLANTLLRLAILPLFAWTWIRCRDHRDVSPLVLAWLSLPAFAVGHGTIAAGVDLAVGFPLFAGSGWLVVVTAGFVPGRVRDGLGLGFAVAAAYTAAFVLAAGPVGGPMFLIPIGLVLLFGPVMSGYAAANLAANLQSAWDHEGPQALPFSLGDDAEVVRYIADLVQENDHEPDPESSISPRVGVHPPAVPGASEPKSRVLIVDAGMASAAQTSGLVSQLGYEPILADTGPDAIEAVLGQNFALVLMDTVMPEMDGFEVTRLIRALGSRGQVPIVAVLPESEVESSRRDFDECGLDGWIAKPVGLEDLRSAISRWAQQASSARG